VVDRAESVRDPVLAAVTHEPHVQIAERCAAVGAFGQAAEIAGLERLAHGPVGALHCPRNDVLEAAESGPAVALVLPEAVAVVRLDRVPAP
jgi:hypothetical protein